MYFSDKIGVNVDSLDNLFSSVELRDYFTLKQVDQENNWDYSIYLDFWILGC